MAKILKKIALNCCFIVVRVWDNCDVIAWVARLCHHRSGDLVVYSPGISTGHPLPNISDKY